METYIILPQWCTTFILFMLNPLWFFCCCFLVLGLFFFLKKVWKGMISFLLDTSQQIQHIHIYIYTYVLFLHSVMHKMNFMSHVCVGFPTAGIPERRN